MTSVYRPNALGLFTRNTEPDFVPIGLLMRQKRNQPQKLRPPPYCKCESLLAPDKAQAIHSVRPPYAYNAYSIDLPPIASARACAPQAKCKRPTVYARPQRAAPYKYRPSSRA